MNIWLNGELETSQPLTEEAVKAIEEIFADSCGCDSVFAALHGTKIGITDFLTGSYADDLIAELVEKLSDLGITLEGSVSYYGDYDGRYKFNGDGTFADLDKDECAIADASDESLIAEIESRGYIVEKKAIPHTTSQTASFFPDNKLPTHQEKMDPPGPIWLTTARKATNNPLDCKEKSSYVVRLTETCEKKVVVWAENGDEAEAVATAAYDNGEIDVERNGFNGCEVCSLGKCDDDDIGNYNEVNLRGDEENGKTQAQEGADKKDVRSRPV